MRLTADSRNSQYRLTRQRGAALLIMLLVVLSVGLALFFRSASTATSNYARDQATHEALAQAKAALIGYAVTFRDTHPDQVFGFLLCPDTDNDGSAQPSCGHAGETMIGRLPYKTLELPDLRSAGGECLWYIVSGSHKNNPKTAPLNWDTRGRIRIEDMSGAALIDPNDDSGGAVAVIIAPGSQLAGQSRPAGGSNCSGDVTNSFGVYLDGNYLDGTVGTLKVTAGQPESAINNDRVAWISARELFSPITKRNDLFQTSPTSTLFDDLKNCFNSQPVLPLPANLLPRSNGNTKTVFLAHDVSPPEYFPKDLPGCAISTNVWKNWKNQFGYVVCDDQTTPCLTVGTELCRGALVFSGRQTSGIPRTASANFDSFAGNTFLEAPNVTSYLNGGSSYSGLLPYSGADPSKDIVLCLKPDPA